MIARLIRKITRHRFGHPCDSRLLLLHDGEIPAKRRRHLQEHLDRCPRCRGRLERIAEEWKELEQMLSGALPDPPIFEETMIAQIRSSIREWSANHLPEESPPDTPGEASIAEKPPGEAARKPARHPVPAGKKAR